MAISLLAVLDTARAWLLSIRGWRVYSVNDVSGRRFAFSGHQVVLEDDQPTDTLSREHERETPGMLSIMIDGRAVGVPSRVGVRRARPNDGRYHSWFDARIFTSRASGDSSLWLARKIPLGRGSANYELTELDSDGSIHTRMLSGWQLGLDFRASEVTGLLTWDSWWPFPLDVIGFVFFPLLFVIYPIGTFVAGSVLWGPGRTGVIHRTAA